MAKKAFLVRNYSDFSHYALQFLVFFVLFLLSYCERAPLEKY